MGKVSRDRLRGLAEEATCGEWRMVLSDNATAHIMHQHGIDRTDVNDVESIVCVMPSEITTEYNSINNARFIAAANPQTILTMLDEIEEMADVLELVRGFLRNKGYSEDDPLVLGAINRVLGDIS